MSNPAPTSLSSQLQATPSPARGSGLLSWSEYLDLLKPHVKLIEDTWAPQSEQLKAEVCKQLVMNISLGYFLYFQGDEWHPDWVEHLPADTPIISPGERTAQLRERREGARLRRRW